MSNEKTQPIRQDYLNGMTYKAISLKYQIDVRTAKRYVQLNLPLSDLEQRPFSSVLDPYKKQIDYGFLRKKLMLVPSMTGLFPKVALVVIPLLTNMFRKRSENTKKLGFTVKRIKKYAMYS